MKMIVVTMTMFVICLCSIDIVQARVSILPLFNGYLTYGNVYYNERAGSAGINYDIDFVPVLVFSERTSLLPRIGSTYVGTLLPKEIQDEGNIYLQLLDTVLSFKYVHKRDSGWAYRVEVGSKKELARETVDENWGKGLYDYQNNYLELNIEKKFLAIPLSIGGGLRPFTIVFPNYKSLASEQGKELEGTNVLNTNNLETFIKIEYLFGKMFFRCSFNNLQSNYSDQKIITESGEYSQDKRRDLYNDFGIGLSYILPEYTVFFKKGKRFKTFLGLNFKFRNKTSDQNHLDTENLYFSEHYYDYGQYDIIPSVTLKFLPSDFELSLSYESIQKNYANRTVQDKDGNYSTVGEKIYQTSQITNLNLAFPVFKKFRLHISGTYRTSKSNMMYEKFYKYNFVSYSYLLGISYQY